MKLENPWKAEPSPPGIGTVVFELILAGLILVLSFRMLSVVFILVYAAVLFAWRWHRSHRLLFCIATVFVISAIQPLDFRFGDVQGQLFGTSRGGIRFVPIVYGLPSHSYLREHYTEYFCGGCCGPIVPARWMLVWN